MNYPFNIFSPFLFSLHHHLSLTLHSQTVITSQPSPPHPRPCSRVWLQWAVAELNRMPHPAFKNQGRPTESGENRGRREVTEETARALTVSRAAVRAGGRGRETKGGDERHRACLETQDRVMKTWREGLKELGKRRKKVMIEDKTGQEVARARRGWNGWRERGKKTKARTHKLSITRDFLSLNCSGRKTTRRTSGKERQNKSGWEREKSWKTKNWRGRRENCLLQRATRMGKRKECE